MNFEDFEKKAKCIYCERPINIHKKLLKGNAKSKLYKCECSLSTRFKFKDGYTFFLPVSNKYEFQIDTRIKSFKIMLIEQSNKMDKTTTIKNILDTNEIPDFILMPRLKLMDKLEAFLAWI